MASDSEHTNRPRPPQQAQGRKWPISVLLVGVVTLALALTACGGESSTSAPDGTNATGATEWDTTNNFSLETGESHYELFPEVLYEKCAQVTFHVTASTFVTVHFHDLDGSGTGDTSVWEATTVELERFASEGWKEADPLNIRGTTTAREALYAVLEVAFYLEGYEDIPPEAKGTISYRVDPPTSGTTC